MFKIEVKAIDEKTDKTRYFNCDFCPFEKVDDVMQEIIKQMKKQLRFADLYERIARQQCALDTSNITYDTLFLSPDAANWLKHEFGWLCNKTAHTISTFVGLKVCIVPELEADFMIGVTNV